jgi:hypothetical protein
MIPYSWQNSNQLCNRTLQKPQPRGCGAFAALLDSEEHIFAPRPSICFLFFDLQLFRKNARCIIAISRRKVMYKSAGASGCAFE